MARPGSMFTVSLTGTSVVLNNINQVIEGLDRGSEGAMRKAVLLVRQASLPLTPVDTTHLRGSQGGDVYKTAGGYSGVIYYTAAYAPYVHEIDKNYKAPGTGWKYLERGLLRSANRILRCFGSELDVAKRINFAQQQTMPKTGSLSDFGESFGFIG